MPGSEDKTLTGIVIKNVPQKESDSMVEAIGPDGLFSFYARGVKKLTSKNSVSVQSLAYSKFVLMSSSSGSLTLKEGGLIKSFATLSNLEALSVLSFLQEVTARLVQPDEASKAYQMLLPCLESLNQGHEPLTIGLIYLAHVLNIGGIGLDVDECVICQKKTGIVAVSYEDGGFVCKDCLPETTAVISSGRKLKIIRYLFRCGIQDLGRVEFSKEELIPLYRELGQYLDDLTSLKLKSLELIVKL